MQDKSKDAVPKNTSTLLDADRFAAMDRHYRQRLVDRMTGIVRDRASAKDLAARAFAKAWQNRESFRGAASPTTWVEAIAGNEAKAHQRRASTHSLDSIDREGFREPATPDSLTGEMEKQDQVARLKRALAQVPENQRRALTAHVVEGRSIREISRTEGIPVGTVLSRIHSGKQYLRDAWEVGGQISSADRSNDQSGSTRGLRPEAPDGDRGR